MRELDIQTELWAETGHLIPRAQNLILGSKTPMFIGVCGGQISGSGMVRRPRAAEEQPLDGRRKQRA